MSSIERQGDELVFGLSSSARRLVIVAKRGTKRFNGRVIKRDRFADGAGPDAYSLGTLFDSTLPTFFRYPSSR